VDASQNVFRPVWLNAPRKARSSAFHVTTVANSNPSIKQTAVQMNMFFIEERDIETIASSEISSPDSFKDT
jgi:hypothetical protein